MSLPTEHGDVPPTWSARDGGRAFLPALPVLAGQAPDFDIDHAPSDPVTLFAHWLRQAVADDPNLVPDEWVSHCVRPAEVEFWQGAPDRRHVRLSYRRADDGWHRVRLWP